MESLPASLAFGHVELSGAGVAIGAAETERAASAAGSAAAGAAPEPRSGESSGAVGPGLVSSKTSVTLHREPARIKRMASTVRTVSQLHQDETGASGYRWWALFLTFTYAPGHDWAPRHMTALIKAVRAFLARQGLPCRYVWVMELHRSGRPHFHAVLWLPKGKRLPKPDLRGWWPWGSTKIELARSPVGYLCKYASKGASVVDAALEEGGGAIPKGARLCGSGGLSTAGRLLRSWRLAPAWVREIFDSPEHRPIRAPGGGWLSRLTGEAVPSPWFLAEHAPDWSWCRFERREVAA